MVHWLFTRIWISLQGFVLFSVFLLISSLIVLWSEEMIDIISKFSYLSRLVLRPSM